MSWYRYSDGERPARRWPVTIDGSAWVSGAIDITCSLAQHSDLDPLWDLVQSDGYDLRPVRPDGTTNMSTFELSGFNKTNRSGTLQIDGWTPSAAGVWLMWLYAGHPSDGASDVTASVSMAGPYSSSIARADPTRTPDRVFRLGGERAKQSTPKKTTFKLPDETIRVFFDVTPALQRRGGATRSQASEAFEEPATITAVQVVDDQGSDYASGYDITDCRWHTDAEGRIYASMTVAAGVSGTEYTAIMTITTSDGLTLQGRGGVSVRTILGS